MLFLKKYLPWLLYLLLAISLSANGYSGYKEFYGSWVNDTALDKCMQEGGCYIVSPQDVAKACSMFRGM